MRSTALSKTNDVTNCKYCGNEVFKRRKDPSLECCGACASEDWVAEKEFPREYIWAKAAELRENRRFRTIEDEDEVYTVPQVRIMLGSGKMLE